LKKIAIFAAAAVLLAAALSVGQHVLVSGPRLRALVNTKPDELLVEYDGATAWIPGTLRFTNLRVRSRDANVEWEFRMPSARLDYAPLALFSRTFDIRRLVASELVFHLRERQHPDRVSRNAPLFPPIEGYSDPPLRDESEPRHPPRTKPPWRIQLDSLDSGPAREIWIGPWRYQGDAHVSGAFTLQPGWRAEVGPATIEFRRVDLHVGQDVVLSGAHGAAHCAIRSFDVRQVKGSQVWPYIDGDFALDGAVASLDFFRHVLDEHSAPAFRKGKGSAKVEIRIERGIGRGGATVEAAGVEAKTSGGALRGDMVMRAELPRWDFEKGEIDVAGSRLELKDVTASTKGGATTRWWGRARIAEGRIHEGLDARVEAECRDARPLYQLFTVKLPGWAQEMLELENLRASAHLRLTSGRTMIEGLSVTGGESRISGEFEDVHGRGRGVFLVEKGKLAVAVQIDGEAHTLRPLGAREWYQAAAAEQRERAKK